MILHLILLSGISSIIMILMRSDFYVTVTKILRFFGWKKNQPGFWPEDDEYQFWTRSQWVTWASLRSGTSNWFWAGFVHLITCPYCLTIHATWITGLVLLFAVGWLDALLVVCYPVCLIFILRLAKYE